MNNFIVREMLSKSLYELFKQGEPRFLCQVPFVNKEGIPLDDEDVEYVNIEDATKDILEAGASPLYYITEAEKFLLPNILQRIENGSGFSEEKINKISQLLIDNISENELKGLLPTHSNMLIKQMLPYEKQLDQLLKKGLQFKQDTNNHYGEDAIEITALKKGSVDFFINLAQNSVSLDFELIYNKEHYNETTLQKEMDKIKEKITLKEADILIDDRYKRQEHENQKETLYLLEKWKLKNKVENINKSDKIKENKFKI